MLPVFFTAALTAAFPYFRIIYMTNELDFIELPWEIVSLDLEPSPVFEALPFQWKCIVRYTSDEYEGHEVVATTVETIQKNYLEGRKLYITAQLPIIEVDGRKTTIRPDWFPKKLFFD